MSQPSAGHAAVHTTAWGLFCASSWTWCIGLYLPVLMIERFGWLGFVVFAIPNVLGCAGFGYMIARRSRSEAMVERHGTAMVAFSLATIAYHMFFISFLFAELFPPTAGRFWLPLFMSLVVLWAGYLLSSLRDRAWLVLAAAMYVFFIIVFGMIGLGGIDHIEASGEPAMSELAWLAPALCIGFLLCPYLDLTFHRALQRAPSRHAFGVFGLTFAALIVFTGLLWLENPGALPWIGLAHLTSQATFTVGAHMREARLSPILRRSSRRTFWLLLPLAAAPLAQIGRLFSDAPETSENTYMRFLVFYGLVFPAYVFLFIGPWRPLAVTRRTIALFALVVLLLMPVYEAGFIQGLPQLLVAPCFLIALFVVLRARTPAGPRRGLD